jgi:peptidoglycan/xylan/chitin deacetylase (PgdA/CDA1 family)
LINLAFHGVGAPERELEPDEEQYWVDADLFGELLDTALELPEARLTFDDGNASDLSIALPMLLDRSLTAAFFVIAGRLGQPGSLGADDVRALAEAGMTIGTHGMQHRPWRSLDDEGYREELDEARELLEAAAGARVDEAACPYGAYDRRALRALKQREFGRVYSVDRRPARPDAWFQPRYVIRRGDSPNTVRGFGGDSRPRALVLAAKTTVKRWR